MIFKIFGIILFLGVSAAFGATEEMKAEPGLTLYGKISTLFDNGTLPDLSKYDGKIVSGRCFSQNAPDVPVAAVFTCANQNQQIGPIASPTVYYKGDSYFDSGKDPSAYDSSGVAISPAYAIEQKDERTYNMFYSSNYTMWIRGSDSYLIGYMASGSEPNLMCYFFNIHN